jgi:hypothetical protein
MATFAKTILSGSTDGKAILVTATSSAGPSNLVHAGPTNTAHLHEVWLYAVNTSTTAVKLTIEFGEQTAPNGNIEVTVQGEAGLTLVVPGLLLKGNASALLVRAFAGTASVIAIHGYVHTIV